jgi:hypothetical protein
MVLGGTSPSPPLGIRAIDDDWDHPVPTGMSESETPRNDMPASSNDPATWSVGGVWLTAGPVREPIEGLLLELLLPNLPNPGLREALVEELGRPVKKLDVALEYLGLSSAGLDLEGGVPLHLVAPKPRRDPWREALVTPGGDCPLGLVLATSDHGRVVLVHEVFTHLTSSERHLVQRYAAMVLAGMRHETIVGRLSRRSRPSRRCWRRAPQVQVLDPSVLWRRGRGHPPTVRKPGPDHPESPPRRGGRQPRLRSAGRVRRGSDQLR